MKKNLVVQLIIIVLCVCSYKTSYAQASSKINVAITKPKMKALYSHTEGNTYLKHIMSEVISESTELVNFIDRGDIKLINDHRENGFKNLETSTGSAQMEGVEYLLESKILNFTENWKNHCHKKDVPYKENGMNLIKKVDTCTHSTIFLTFEMELELISVESGEIISKRNISPTAWSYESYIKSPTEGDKHKMRIKAYQDMKPCLAKIWSNNLLKILLPEIKIVDVAKANKGKAQKVYIAGGKNSRYPINAPLEVVKKYEEKIGDELIEREEKIGEISIEETFHGYSICDVKKGKEEIYKAINSNEPIYCKPGKMLKLEGCGTPYNRSKSMKMIQNANKVETAEERVDSRKNNSSSQKTSSSTAPKEIKINARKPSTTTTKKGGGED